VIFSSLPPFTSGASNPIITENLQPGTGDWQINLQADDINQQIKGYASAASVNKGGSLTFYVTVNPVRPSTSRSIEWAGTAGWGVGCCNSLGRSTAVHSRSARQWTRKLGLVADLVQLDAPAGLGNHLLIHGKQIRVAPGLWTEEGDRFAYARLQFDKWPGTRAGCGCRR
jgi:hypothetical protein